jgi:hypothetical protein
MTSRPAVPVAPDCSSWSGTDTSSSSASTWAFVGNLGIEESLHCEPVLETIMNYIINL